MQFLLGLFISQIEQFINYFFVVSESNLVPMLEQTLNSEAEESGTNNSDVLAFVHYVVSSN